LLLSFDVEEHHRIEAAARLSVNAPQREHYRDRLELSTRWLLEELARRMIKATFFVLGEVAQHQPRLVRAIHEAGHEVGSHGWDHQRLLGMTPESFRKDLRQSKDALEQVTGAAVVGYRAPTFSIVRSTSWAIDVLAEQGFLYDSSIYPVRHDRYGIPSAPRSPFLVRGLSTTILELPLATLRILGWNVPMGGGGYFRLFPLPLLEHALRQLRRTCQPPVTMLYFHPWEFDPAQERLPLPLLSRWRTYVGLARTRARLRTLLASHQFDRAKDAAVYLDQNRSLLPTFQLNPTGRR
jgi:polysaccharide deacetylase family protein (PEP-CTERM system associated)